MPCKVSIYFSSSFIYNLPDKNRFAGLATHFVPSSNLEALETCLAELDDPTHDMVHQTIEEFGVNRDHIPSTYTLHGKDRRIMDTCFKHEHMEDVLIDLKNEGSQFSNDTIETILKRSPTSVKITHEHIRKGSGLSLKECLNMEHRLWQTVPVCFILLLLLHTLLDIRKIYLPFF